MKRASRVLIILCNKRTNQLLLLIVQSNLKYFTVFFEVVRKQASAKTDSRSRSAAPSQHHITSIQTVFINYSTFACDPVLDEDHSDVTLTYVPARDETTGEDD